MEKKKKKKEERKEKKQKLGASEDACVKLITFVASFMGRARQG